MANAACIGYILFTMNHGKSLSIYDYSDYRQYLSDYYETHKAADRNFSLRYLSQQAGINSSAFFKFIMEGKRNLTQSTILKVCTALKLNPMEADYFEQLVLFNQGKTTKEKNVYFARIIERQKVRNVATIQLNQYDYFAKWYHCAIRELVVMKDFNKDFAKLGRLLNPHITETEARDSVKLLLTLGFLKVENGTYKQNDPIISTGYSLRDHQIINFQIAMLKRAIESFDTTKAEERLTSSSTFAVSPTTFVLYCRMLRELRGRMLEIARNETDPEMVYQLNVNLFPLSKSRRLQAGKNG